MRYLGQMKTYHSHEIPADCSVGIGFECIDRDMIKPEKCYHPLAACGAKYARCQTGWAKCESEKGVYNWGWLDDIVNNLLSRGVIPWFNVGYGNPAYMPHTPNPTGVGCMPLLYEDYVVEGWKNYVRALAEHFKGRVTHFEIWNEPDIVHFWHPGEPDAAAYAELIKLTGGIIRSVIPDARIGACTSSNPKHEYVSKLLENLSPADLDFYCFHTYKQYPEELINTGFYSSIIAIAKEKGMDHLDFWMGEGGHASWHPVYHRACKGGGGSEHRQAVWQLRRFLLDFKIGLKLTSQFQIADMMERPYQMATSLIQNTPARQGILNGIIYTPKKAHDTMSRLSVILSGKREIIEDQIEISAPKQDYEPIILSYLREGNEINIYWLPIPIEEERPMLKKSTQVKLLSDAIKNPMVIDLFTGIVLEPEDCEWNPETRVISGLPIGEYPILICDKDTFEVE